MINIIKTVFKNLLLFIILLYILVTGIGITFSNSLIFLPQPSTYTLSSKHIVIDSENSNSAINSNASSHRIIADYLEHPDSKFTVLYSHGNAVDLGGLKHLQNNFYHHGYSIIIYDYSGYGESEGTANEQQVYNDVQAVYNYLINVKNLKPENIIAYGHSLGTAIATQLAEDNPVAGLVLESPFTTAFRVKTVYPIIPFDKFTSIKKIKTINTPVLIAHSQDDTIIPYWHGVELFETANQPKTFISFENDGHVGITHNEKFWQAFEKFVATL